MKISVIAVGKIKERYLKEGIAEYSKRLSRFCDLEIAEVEDEQAPESLTPSQEASVKRKEAERVLKRIKEGSVVIVLEVKGKRLKSEEFAEKLNSFFISGSSHITFLIGGSLGVDQELLDKADLKLSVSDMTFPHQLARLILLEQLYRAFKIIRGEPYHK
ncbi:MAG: 23S rRNA (pseudouridine(1915)-N(3))-methyltransferase RlmH [Clostridia bacterium]|nr:23S rRNA (pseudouridine(1915)-N(3))-methyltransferase RlmH [Clostridia bacterium]